ncbi:MAG: HAD-IA family hydrolase, partial [Spirochaetaceae bacterium]|nr:HAD-IA family hydrolase [Spirochaetaceae bacterium]
MVVELFKERHGLAGTVDELIAEKDVAYLALASGNTTVFSPIRELILALQLRGVRLAVATSSRRVILDTMLEETGLTALFPVTVSSDDVDQPKPDPEVFLQAARRLKVSPGQCCVIEDSQYGVQAAVRAGMRVIAVPAPGHEDLPAFRQAELVIPGGAAALRVTEILAALELNVATQPADSSPAIRKDPTVAEFRHAIHEHYHRHRRKMPWRETLNPYEILVSEIMLQQTQADRVVPKYREFLDSFPTVQRLARASLQEVLQRWQGLGYNRRGKHLHDTAREIMDRFDGTVPRSARELRTLPGVGPYTAGAVRAFAFNAPAVFVETNIRRVFIHLFFPGRESVADREILPLIGVTLDCEDPRNWYYALMDFGAHLAGVFGNANRRSAHYQRQGPFVGSVREVRGMIIRILTANGGMERSELERHAGPEDSRFPAAIEGLAR